jgi:stringent starvation protein B
MTQQLPPKKEVALALLERSNVDVYLDPRAKGVVVPPQFRKEPRLILKIGLNMPVPIPDLRLDDESMSCTLSFNRSPFYCVVPWTSVFAMVGEDGRGMVWPDDVPQELAVKVVDPGEQGTSSSSVDGTAGTANPAGPGGPVAAAAATGRRGETSRRATGATGKGGKKKKKEEGPARPVLVAVPSGPLASTVPPNAPAPTSIRQPPGSRRPRPTQPASDATARPRDGVSPVPTRPRPAPSGPKRELPPYLRVVK